VNRDASREWTIAIYRRYLPGGPDAYTTFLHLAESACPEGGRAIDLGCGEECYLACLLQKAGEIIGLDDRPLQGPYGRYIQTDLNRDICLERESADLAAGKFLVEHLADPPRFLRKVHAVLRPGGRLILMTPNILYYPYTVNYLLSRLLPQERRMHLVELFSGRPPHDIFPVHYRCNTPRKIRLELEKAGFEVLHLDTYSDCQVSAVTRPLGALAVAYEKMVSLLGIKGAGGFIVAAARRK
jgi:SAM-dependent methyltransferase